MLYNPVIDGLEKAAKAFVKWFFCTCIFMTAELQSNALTYFESGNTAFRWFEWLDLRSMRRAYPNRWKHIVADFGGAYLKLFLLATFVSLVVVRSFGG